MARALNTPFEVSGVGASAGLPPRGARRSPPSPGLGAVTALRLEGPAPSVAFRAEALEALFGHGERLDDAASGAILARKSARLDRSLPPGARVDLAALPARRARRPRLRSAIAGALPSAESFFDWGGGLVWLSLDREEAGPDAGAAIVRGAMKPRGGHATLVVAPDGDARPRRRCSSRSARSARRRSTARVKASFDPQGVLNPGRMREGR